MVVEHKALDVRVPVDAGILELPGRHQEGRIHDDSLEPPHLLLGFAIQQVIFGLRHFLRHNFLAVSAAFQQSIQQVLLLVGANEDTSQHAVVARGHKLLIRGDGQDEHGHPPAVEHVVDGREAQGAQVPRPRVLLHVEHPAGLVVRGDALLVHEVRVHAVVLDGRLLARHVPERSYELLRAHLLKALNQSLLPDTRRSRDDQRMKCPRILGRILSLEPRKVRSRELKDVFGLFEQRRGHETIHNRLYLWVLVDVGRIPFLYLGLTFV
mmetsp:Transcript_7929/g.18109  ORF Transcript_7929/g.18109 Transcript_7929/m.18109 type:complete len:267 (+) Transcript_7929:305-1105(+)